MVRLMFHLMPLFALSSRPSSSARPSEVEFVIEVSGPPPQPSYLWPRASWLDFEVAHRFQSRPPKELWEERLHRGIEAARSDPCNAAVLVTAGPFNNGFGARMQNIANDVWLAAYDSNNSIALCAEAPFIASSWMELFENKRDFPICRSGCKDRYPEYSGSWEQSRHAADHLRSIDKTYMADLKRFAITSVFVPKATLAQQMTHSLDAMGLKAGEYVGVHIRHGDKGSEAPLLPVRRYAAEVKRLLQAEAKDIRTVFVASDDDTAHEKMQAELGDAARVVRQAPEPGSSYNWRTMDLNTLTANASQHVLLTDIAALHKAKVFVGTGTSTLGRLVYYLRGHEEPSVSLDYPWEDFGA